MKSRESKQRCLLSGLLIFETVRYMNNLSVFFLLAILSVLNIKFKVAKLVIVDSFSPMIIYVYLSGKGKASLLAARDALQVDASLTNRVVLALAQIQLQTNMSTSHVRIGTFKCGTLVPYIGENLLDALVLLVL